ncbi:MAG: hypothetical protein SGARI_006774, partial [Bacillariaceae sp.]
MLTRALSFLVTVAACEAFAPSSSVVVRHAAATSSSSSTNLYVATATATALEELSKMTTISIDSGDLDVVAKYAKTGLITDATTNPLFVSQAGASGDKRYGDMVFDAIMYAKEQLGGGDSPLADFEPEINMAMDKLAVNLGAELTKLVPGRVSTEVDVRLSYDTDASVERARGLIAMYEAMGIDRSRILIKLAGTWEGIQAARILEKENIQCNITLIFSGKDSFHPTADPGVLSVKRMYAYFKKYGYETICMPSSWRPSRGPGAAGSDVDEILALAGVDEMTIPPTLLEALLKRESGDVTRECDEKTEAAVCCDPDFTMDEAT